MINKMKVVDNPHGVTSIVRRYFYIMISGLAPESAAAIDLKLLRLIKHTIDKEYTYAKKTKCTE